MTNLLPNLRQLRHHREIRAFGLRRSGNHAILNWICANALGAGQSVCFLNDVNHNLPAKEKMLRGIQLPSAPTAAQTDIRKSPDLAVLSFEEENALEMATELNTGREDYELIWIRRDPAEVWASRIARVEKLKNSPRKGERWEFDLVTRNSSGRFRMLETLDSYRSFPPRTLVLHYELWHNSLEYRKQIASRLRIGRRDKGKHKVPGWGFGSSFGKPPASGELRYPQFADHPLMIEFLAQLKTDFRE